MIDLAPDGVADRALQRGDHHHQAEQPQRSQERQHDDHQIEEVSDEPFAARIRQVQPGEVVRDEDEVQRCQRRTEHDAATTVGCGEYLNRVEAEEMPSPPRPAATRCGARSGRAGIAASSTADPNGNELAATGIDDDMTDLAGRKALVTGGSRGIGAEIVRRLAADGAAVAFTYGASAAEAEKLAAEVAADGGTAVAIQADSSDPERSPGRSTRRHRRIGRVGRLGQQRGRRAHRGRRVPSRSSSSTGWWRSMCGACSSRRSARSPIWATAAGSSTSAASTPTGCRIRDCRCTR